MQLGVSHSKLNCMGSYNIISFSTFCIAPAYMHVSPRVAAIYAINFLSSYYYYLIFITHRLEYEVLYSPK